VDAGEPDRALVRPPRRDVIADRDAAGQRAARTVLNRLWPLLLSTLGAGVVGFALPQVPAIATGFAIIWALGWRRQASAVTAIEERDGARFYVEHTSPLQPIKLVRTPGFRTNLLELNGASASRQARPRA
jgi:hypothetical protein